MIVNRVAHGRPLARPWTARACVLAAFAAAAAAVSPAYAQQPKPPAQTAPEQPQLVPPRLLSDANVAYPQGATGEATVVLILTIGRDGRVKEAKASDGQEPFASVAVAAAETWVFEPAQRAGQPVASKIRFEVKFVPPQPIEEPAAQPAAQTGTAPAASPAAQPPKPPPPDRIDVTVQGVKPIAAVSMGRAEVRQLPGAFGDPFRAVEIMPGVTPMISGMPFFYVRGSPPGNVGYFLDGIRVPYLYHVGMGPSVIHPGMVDRVDLYPGGYPARYGRFAGGIVSAETTAPRTDLHGEANLRLYDVGALAESGFANGKGTVLLAGRYSYTGLALSLIAKDIRLDYRDYEARVSYDVTPRDKITLFSFGAFDQLQARSGGQFVTFYGAEFYRADLRWDHQFGPGSSMRAAVTYGFDQTRMAGQPLNLSDNMVSARLQGSHELSSKATWRGGADVTFDAYRADKLKYADQDDPGIKEFNALFPERNDMVAGVWTDLPLHTGDWELVPGIRVDWFKSGDATAVGVDPRISSRLKVAEHVHVTHAIGIAHQTPSFVIPMPGLAIGSLKGGLQRSVQASAGVEVELPQSITASLTAFDNVLLHMTDAMSTANTEATNAFEQRSLGSAKGLEVYVRRRLTHRLGGFISYTLSQSMRSVGAERFPSTFDRRHVLNAAVSLDLGRRWRAGTRFTLYSGAPVQKESEAGLITPARSAHPPRDPLFYRLDLRLEKRWNLAKGAWISFVAEMYNATLHKEVLLGTKIGPISIPSIGAEGGF